MSDRLVVVDESTILRLERLAKSMGVSEKYLPIWINYTLNHDSNEFAEFVKMFWISGQAINRVTDETFNSLKPYVPTRRKRKLETDGVYYSVRPGVGVKGNLNFHGRWAKPAYQQFGHEFMRPSFASFTAGERVERDVLKNIDSGFQWALNGGGK